MRSFVIFAATCVLMVGGWTEPASAEPVTQTTPSTAESQPDIGERARVVDRRGVVLARRIRHHLHLARLSHRSEQARRLDTILSRTHSALRRFSSQLQELTEVRADASPQDRLRAETSLRLARERFNRLQRLAEDAIGGALEIPLFGAERMSQG